MKIRERLDNLEKQTPICVYGIDVVLDHLPASMELLEVNLNPDYQRGHVWTLEQREAFVGAFLENHRGIPPIILNFPNGKNSRPSEVVDGKQRITSLLAFLNGEITAKCPCEMEFHIDEIKQDEVAMRMIGIHMSLRWNFVALPQKQVMEYYLRLNSGGTIHTKKELDRVRGLIEQF